MVWYTHTEAVAKLLKFELDPSKISRPACCFAEVRVTCVLFIVRRKLVLYPNGDKSRNGDGYISLYLVMADTTGFSPGWEINAIFKLFVHDQLQDKYLTIGDGRLRRFSAIKNKWGFPQMLSLSIFNNASNGYLIGDSCVFVIKNEGKGEHFSMIKDPSGGTFTWEVQKFSELTKEFYYSQVYLAGRHQWKLTLFPNGEMKQRGKHLSLFLGLNDHTKFHAGWKLFVEFTLRIRDQVRSHHHEQTMWTKAFKTDTLSILLLHSQKKEYLEFGFKHGYRSEVIFNHETQKKGLGVMKKEVMEEEKEAMEKVTVVQDFLCHYSMKIDSFSVLSEMVDNSYESREFEASGYNWSPKALELKLYPNGDTQPRGKHLSLFLELRDRTKFHAGWKLFVEFTLRIRDQVRSHHHEKTRNWFSTLMETRAGMEMATYLCIW
uniref:MATH domain-containing protein n=1 Tax=Salix viminalis TaxID=40686 RepID=A0A6N2L163_SALVM